MESQKPQPVLPPQPIISQPLVPPTQSVASVAPSSKPTISISESEAQALLAINGLDASNRPKKQLPTKLIIIIGSLIAVAVLASYLVGAVKPGSSSKSGIGIPNQTNSSSGDGTSKQINQDVNSCSNAVNAVTVC